MVDFNVTRYKIIRTNIFCRSDRNPFGIYRFFSNFGFGTTNHRIVFLCDNSKSVRFGVQLSKLLMNLATFRCLGGFSISFKFPAYGSKTDYSSFCLHARYQYLVHDYYKHRKSLVIIHFFVWSLRRAQKAAKLLYVF